MSKALKIYFAIVAILAIMVSVLVFVIPFDKKCYATFITSYIFLLVSLLCQGYVAFLVFKKSSSLKSKIYGIPVIRVSMIYLMIQFISTFAIIAANAFVCVPVWIPVCINIVILGFAAIGILLTSAVKDFIESVEKEEKQRTAFLNNFKIEVESLSNKTSDEALNKDIYKFIEKVKYSDPMSSDKLVDIENEINVKYMELKELVLNDDIENAKKALVEINDLMDKRNRICKLEK
ncbi:MAG: hypothetical protein J6Y28_01265 [Acholeplasmatales bacterium]|nr:hypothetical protein [Acholeplasmatales bacterium]